MQERGWKLGACVLFAGCACACSSGSVPATADASAVDSAGPPAPAGGDAGDASAPDVYVPPVVDAGPPDAAADAAPDASACAWDGGYESPACSACLGTACCSVVMTCEDDPACVALDQCVDACLTNGGGDAGSVSNCAQACADARPASVQTEWHGLSDCVEFQCSNGGAGPCQ